jgi:hypothetical protein
MPGNPLPLLVFLAVIAGVIFTVIKDVKITLFGKAFRIDFSALPLTGVLVLLVCQSLSLRSLWRGVAGDDAIRPYSILTLFMSLAYISVSVDKTRGWHCRLADSPARQLSCFSSTTFSVQPW